MNAVIFEIAMCFIFLIGNVMHTLLIAYQHVQVAKKFNGYKAWMAAFWVPELVRTSFQVVAFGIILPWLSNIDYKTTVYDVPIAFKFNAGWAWMLGFMSDVLMSIAAQKLADRYPSLKFLVAQIPTQLDIDAQDENVPADKSVDPPPSTPAAPKL